PKTSSQRSKMLLNQSSWASPHFVQGSGLPRRQGKHNVLTRPRRRYRVGCRCARLEDSGSTDRHGDVFTTVHLIDGRHAFLWTWQIVFPKDLAVILVVRPKFSIRRASCENESAGSDNHATTWCDAANVFAGLSKSRHAAVRNLPENLA